MLTSLPPFLHSLRSYALYEGGSGGWLHRALGSVFLGPHRALCSFIYTRLCALREALGSIASLFTNYPYFNGFVRPLISCFSLPSLSMEKAGSIGVHFFSRQ